ncbi:hypothetical protein Tco_1172300 [Tanacetum coccineum]
MIGCGFGSRCDGDGVMKGMGYPRVDPHDYVLWDNAPMKMVQISVLTNDETISIAGLVIPSNEINDGQSMKSFWCVQLEVLVLLGVCCCWGCCLVDGDGEMVTILFLACSCHQMVIDAMVLNLSSSNVVA